jgi:predicted component of type VI protein secretion system
MTICPECSHNNIPGVAFCDECGHDLSMVALPPSTAGGSTVVPDPAPATSSSPAVTDPFGDPFGDPFAGAPAISTPVQIPDVTTSDIKTPIEPTSGPDVLIPSPLTPPSVPVVQVQQPNTNSTASLTVERNGQIGQTFPVTKSTLIGKWDMDEGIFPEIDATSQDPEGYISRKHVLIEEQNGQWSIKDLGSTNGTAVNRQKLTAQQAHPLSDGDEIIVGRLFLRFRT